MVVVREIPEVVTAPAWVMGDLGDEVGSQKIAFPGHLSIALLLVHRFHHADKHVMPEGERSTKC